MFVVVVVVPDVLRGSLVEWYMGGCKTSRRLSTILLKSCLHSSVFLCPNVTRPKRVARGVLGCPWPPLVGLLLSKQPTIFRWRKRHNNNLAVKAIVEKPTFLKNFFCKVFSSKALVFISYGRGGRHDNLVSSLCDPSLKNPGYAPEASTWQGIWVVLFVTKNYPQSPFLYPFKSQA